MTEWKQFVAERVPRMMLPPAREAEILEELAELLEDTYNDARAAGLSHEDALAAASAQLPEGEALAQWIEQAERPVAAHLPHPVRPARIEERALRFRPGVIMNNFLQDVKYAVRMLGKHPGYTALAVIALALGIGANTAIFSMGYALLEKPVALPDAKGLYAIEDMRLDTPGIYQGMSPANLKDVKEQSTSFSAWAASQWYDTNISGEGTPERIQGFRVTANYFDVLTARALHGRTFLPGEDTPGREHVAVLAHGLWERRFGADPRVIGKIVRLEGQPYEIVGVMPKGLDYPVTVDVWMPMVLTPAEEKERTGRSIDVIARLKPGVSKQQAQAEIRTVTARLLESYPEDNKGWRTDVLDIRERVAGNLTRDYMSLMMGAVLFVLLIACANVANLQLARATGRYREVAVRVALGASRWRVVRQLITESVLQAFLAVGLGMVFAYWSLELIRDNFPADVLKFVPGINIMGLDWATFAYSFAIALLAGMLAGLMPALHVSHPNLNESLRDGGRGSSTGRGRHLTRNMLVVAEMALALVLLVGAGLMIHGTRAIRTQHDGMQPQTLLTFQVNLPDAKYKEMAPRIQFFDQVSERLKAVPGAQSVALGRSVPFSDNTSSNTYSIEGVPLQSGETRVAQSQSVNAEWFKTIGITLKEGRTFTYADGPEAPLVAVVSERFAKRHWPNESPLGRRVKFGRDSDETPWRTIVGVVNDIQYNWFETTPRPVLYVPARQSARQLMQFAVRASGNPLALTESVRKAVASVDPDMPIYQVKTHAQVIHESVIGITYIAVMLAVLGVIALVLASVGLYGVMAYAVTERTHEIGVRMALGAQSGDVLRLMLRRGVVLTSIGLTIGAALSFGLARLVSRLIVGVGATDMSTFGGVIGLLAFVALAATYIPARRAARVDPLIALRYE